MQLWADAILILLVALALDRFIGEPPNIIHPLRWLGNILGWVDVHIKNRGKIARLWGFVAYLSMFFLVLMVTMTVIVSVKLFLSGYNLELGTGSLSMSLSEAVWIIICGLFMKFSFAIFSFRKHCIPIQEDLRNDRVEEAAAKVQMIVSRNTKGMDPAHMASSCCETVTENLVDSAMSPTFYAGLFGLPGAIMFRCANLMDAMWGYLNEKYGNLGFFPAKFDDILGFFTSRISPYFVVLGAWVMRLKDHPSILIAAREEHNKTPSPNSGYPMTACAAALNISMEKTDVYVMGVGPMPTVDDITRCYHLVEVTSLLFVIIVVMPFYAMIGIHVQMFFEDIVSGLIGVLI